MIKFAAEQQDALDAMLSGENVFLTGKAGTGKSTIIKAFSKHAKQCAFLAPTGLAAINIDGSTIHRFFNFKSGVIAPSQEQKKPVTPSFSKLIKSLKTIIIDEISMVRADVFEAIDIRLRKAMENNLPFGGLQIILVGDFFQIPPVALPKDKKYLGYCGFSNYFCFNTNAWKNGRFTVKNLTEVHRKEGESHEFMQALNAIREGSKAQVYLDFFNNRYQVKLSGTPVVLCTTNKKADEINELELAKLKTRSFICKSTSLAQKGNRLKPTDLPMPSSSTFKVGARVMSISNNEADGYMNGNLGTIINICEDSITVDFDLIDKPIIVKRKTWKIHKYQYNSKTKSVISKEIGEFKQFPIKLAWAVTIHKAQGQTLDNVILDLGKGTFDHGQLYVALSRVRSIEHLSLSSTIKPKDVRVNSDIKDFMKNLHAPHEQTQISHYHEDTISVSIPKRFEKQIHDYLEKLLTKENENDIFLTKNNHEKNAGHSRIYA